MSIPESLECYKYSEYFRVRVEDEGLGVDPKICEGIFDGLYSDDILHHRQGIGLSFAISREIIEKHGGKLTCRNRKEKGTVIDLILKENSAI